MNQVPNANVTNSQLPVVTITPGSEAAQQALQSGNIGQVQNVAISGDALQVTTSKGNFEVKQVGSVPVLEEPGIDGFSKDYSPFVETFKQPTFGDYSDSNSFSVMSAMMMLFKLAQEDQQLSFSEWAANLAGSQASISSEITAMKKDMWTSLALGLTSAAISITAGAVQVGGMAYSMGKAGGMTKESGSVTETITEDIKPDLSEGALGESGTIKFDDPSITELDDGGYIIDSSDSSKVSSSALTEEDATNITKKKTSTTTPKEKTLTPKDVEYWSAISDRSRSSQVVGELVKSFSGLSDTTKQTLSTFFQTQQKEAQKSGQVFQSIQQQQGQYQQSYAQMAASLISLLAQFGQNTGGAMGSAAQGMAV
jgi:hypothetical protein